MIAITHSVLEVTSFEAQGILPALLVPREPDAAWYVRCLPVGEPGAGWEWSLSGSVLRIPLFPYLIHSTDPELAITYGVQLGLQSLWDLTGGDAIVRAHLVAGYPLEDREDHLRFWFGLALLVERR